MMPSYAGALYARIARLARAARPIGEVADRVPIRRVEESLWDISRWFKRPALTRPAVEAAEGTMQVARAAEPSISKSAVAPTFNTARMNVNVIHVDRPVADAANIVERTLTKGFAY